LKPDFVQAAVDIARQAGQILLRHFGRVRVEYKGEVDLVTAADRESESFIVGRLRSLFPGHDLIGEEGSRTEKGSDFKWYIDPLDGTTNFAHGVPFFAVSLALENRGKMIAGVVYNPPLEEMFTAQAESPAALNGKPIHVSATAHLAEALVATGFPTHKRQTNPNIYFYQAVTYRSHGVRRFGSAALDLCYTACGRFEGFWEFNLQPWDTAAGVLILECAGGRVTDMFGGSYNVDSPEILATNGRIHAEILGLFTEVFAGRAVEELPSAEVYQQLRHSSTR
jgi:myo-inositol-1(or 4)-monophosphatase